MFKDQKRHYFKIKQKVFPNSLTNFTDSKCSDYLDYAFSKDIIWVFVSAIDNKCVKLGQRFSRANWIMDYVREVSFRCKNAQSYILEYLEVVPLPPRDNVCKWYMDNLSKKVGQLDLDYLFLHAEEVVYSKLMMIK